MPELTGQPCMMCGEKKAVLHEEEIDIPHFGKAVDIVKTTLKWLKRSKGCNILLKSILKMI